MRLISSIGLLLICTCILANKKVSISPLPKWITTIEYDNQNKPENIGGYYYYLLDFQDNIIEESIFRHYAYEMTNSEGIEEMSDISVDFDPKYQSLEFHFVHIIRNGQIINKLKKDEIKVIQRETKLERLLYDGSLTAIINIKDVREGDLLEYAYSKNGFNPVHNGHYYQRTFQEFSDPIGRIYTSVSASKNQNLRIKYSNSASEVQLNEINDIKQYFFDIKLLPARSR